MFENAKLRWFLLAPTLLATFIIVTSSTASGASKTGYVDIAAAAKSTKEWKKSFLVFKELFEREKSFVNSWRKKIKEQTRELNDNLNYMDYDSKKEKEDALLENKREFERYVQDKNEEFSEKEKEMTSPILKKNDGSGENNWHRKTGDYDYGQRIGR